MSRVFQEVSLFAALIGALCIALELGFRAGRRAADRQDQIASGQVGAIQGALLGLLGLLLAFSFAAASARFIERQDLIVTESNAIGTAFLRADVLDEHQGAELRDALRRYTAHRIAATHRIAGNVDPKLSAEVARFHEEMWKAAVAGVNLRPASTVVVLEAVNDVIDLHSLRVAAGLKHIPWIVLALLLSCSFLALAVIGYGCGMSGSRRAPMTLSLALVIAVSLWITIDLDHPRRGLLRLNDQPLVDLDLGPH